MRPLRILQFGEPPGQLATELVRAGARDDGIMLSVAPLQAADFSRPETVAAFLREAGPFDVAVNAAAYTAVDKAESEEDLAQRINAQSPGILAQVCAERGAPLVHVSTDYVYDGAKPGPYREDDATHPLGAYGRTKLAGEELIRAGLDSHVILRTSWVYSAHGNNFVKTMLRLARERQELSVVNDQHGAPTAAKDLAGAILTIARRLADPASKPAHGTFHFTGGGETSWHGFAAEIFRQAGIETRVAPITTAEYPTPAKRPANSRLDCSKIRTDYGIESHAWQEALSDVLAELGRQGAEDRR